MAVSNPPTVYVSDGSALYYQKNGGKTSLNLSASVSIAKIFHRKVNYFFIGDREEGIYEQNGEKFFIPPGISDVLTVARGYIENPVPGLLVDTFKVFVNKTVNKVIFERYCSEDMSKRRVSVRGLEGELGGGIENLDFYMMGDFVDPVNIGMNNRHFGKRDFRINIMDEKADSRKP